MSLIKTPEQIELMREGGKILSAILSELAENIKEGLDVWDLEVLFLQLCVKNNVRPACKGYTSDNRMPPYPTGLCTYINTQSVHCYPIKNTILKSGDILTIDTVIEYKNMYLDASFAKAIGKVDAQGQKLIDVSKNALLKSEARVADGVRIGVISNTMMNYVQSNGFDVLRDYAGHGIGTHMHEEPEVACFGYPNQGVTLKTGMTICIEALVCEGNPRVDNVSEWETKMHDNKRFLQFEHTVLVTPTGFEVLTPLTV